MELSYGLSFYLLCFSALVLAAFAVMILRMKNKTQIHKAFLVWMIILFIWCIGHILEVITTIRYGYTIWAFVDLYYLGLCFTPVAMVFTCIIFVQSNIKSETKYFLLLIPPVIDYAILLTNPLHHWYLQEYSIFADQTVFGPLAFLHYIVTYSYMVFAIVYLTRFTIKDSGFFSRQSILILFGALIPLVVNVLISFKIVLLPVYYTVL